MFASRYVHMFPKQRDLMGFDEVGRCWSLQFLTDLFMFWNQHVCDQTDSQMFWINKKACTDSLFTLQPEHISRSADGLDTSLPSSRYRKSCRGVVCFHAPDVWTNPPFSFWRRRPACFVSYHVTGLLTKTNWCLDAVTPGFRQTWSKFEVLIPFFVQELFHHFFKDLCCF